MVINLTLNTSSKTFRYAFALSLLVFAAVLFAAASYSWTGPSSTPPNGNVEAPINVGATSQVKSGALSVNGLSVYGSQYIQSYLGVGAPASSPWRIYAPGGQYGIYGEATDGQAIRGYASSGYAGYFIGYGGVFAQNSSGYYGFLGYPGTAWSFYGNGNTYTSGYSRADGGFCIGGSCVSRWEPSGTLCGLASVSYEAGQPLVVSCAGYDPRSGCPSGYSSRYLPIYGGAHGQSFYTCSKN